MRWGIAGCGNIVKRRLGKVFAEARGAEIIALMDIDEKRLSPTGERLKVKTR